MHVRLKCGLSLPFACFKMYSWLWEHKRYKHVARRRPTESMQGYAKSQTDHAKGSGRGKRVDTMMAHIKRSQSILKTFTFDNYYITAECNSSSREESKVSMLLDGRTDALCNGSFLCQIKCQTFCPTLQAFRADLLSNLVNPLSRKSIIQENW